MTQSDTIRTGGEELTVADVSASARPAGASDPREYYRVERVRQAPPRRPVQAPVVPPLAALLVKSGHLKGQRLVVRTPVANIGRAEYNDLKLSDPSISASHAKLQLRQGVWVLSDLGSTSGSQVDGEAAIGEMPLAPGATIALGEVRLFFEPLDGGIRRAGAPVLGIMDAVEAALAAAATAAPRRPPRPARRPRLRTVLLVGVLLAALVLVGYLFLG